MKELNVWRYMDFTKFVDLLSTGSLFFCRSDKLGDPFEGAVPAAFVNKMTFHSEIPSKEYEKELEMYYELGTEFRKYVFVSCWHRNDYESAALWRLYLKSDEGIALLSSENRLHTSTRDKRYDTWFVPVQYIDYDRDDPPVPTRMAPFRYKRKSFEHEKEVRLVWFAPMQDENGEVAPPPSETGVRVKVDLNRLIRAVYVSPTSADWFRDLTKAVCRSFGLRKQVRQSSLTSDTPMFV